MVSMAGSWVKGTWESSVLIFATSCESKGLQTKKLHPSKKNHIHRGTNQVSNAQRNHRGLVAKILDHLDAQCFCRDAIGRRCPKPGVHWTGFPPIPALEPSLASSRPHTPPSPIQMHALMLQQVAGMRKALATETTLVGRVSRVQPLVDCAVVQVLEVPGAKATGVGAHGAVHPAMLQEQRGPGEGFAAGVAGVGPLACVRAPVDGKVG